MRQGLTSLGLYETGKEKVLSNGLPLTRNFLHLLRYRASVTDACVTDECVVDAAEQESKEN